jgi:dephospho-CoA kinase
MKGQKKDNGKLILGITGGFGTGKTTVARMFKAFGAQIIDADKLAQKNILPGRPAYRKVIDTFGKAILKKDKSIDRKILAKIVFNNSVLLKRLNSIIHPAVIKMIKNKISLSKAKVIVLDVPLLVEAGLNKFVDRLIVVKTTRSRQLERIQDRTSLNRVDILKRIRSQAPLSKKVRLADLVIDNNGSLERTRMQVKKIWNKIRRV